MPLWSLCHPHAEPTVTSFSPSDAPLPTPDKWSHRPSYSWFLRAGEDDNGNNVDDSGHGQLRQQDTRVFNKDDDSGGTCIVKDERQGGTSNPSIDGERIRPTATAAAATTVTVRRCRPPLLLFSLLLSLMA
jgi:hypothetical protein